METPRAPAIKDNPELVFFDESKEPGTHVLIVGIRISDYPWLLGGEYANAKIAAGMAQLDAPAISARALATWFLEQAARMKLAKCERAGRRRAV